MWHKEYGDVDVYNIINKDGRLFGICYVPSLADQQNEQGWISVKMSKLIPYPDAEIYKTGQSKAQQNKISLEAAIKATKKSAEVLNFIPAQEITESHWIVNKSGDGICANCGLRLPHFWDQDGHINYCGRCGAYMWKEEVKYV